MENEKTNMETVKEECNICGSSGIRTTLTYPNGHVQVVYKCDNLDCGNRAESEPPKEEPEVKGTCPNCKEMESLKGWIERHKEYSENWINEAKSPEEKEFFRGVAIAYEEVLARMKNKEVD